jgi:hypothetical protein
VYNSFAKDLIIGQEIEKELAELLSKRNPKSKIEFNTSSTNDIKELRKYDFTLSNNSSIHKIEVKYDKKASQTNNVAIEVKCVNHSEADLFAYKIKNDFYFIKTEKLKTLIESKQYRFVNACENGKNYIMLMSISEFEKHCYKTKIKSDF